MSVQRHALLTHLEEVADMHYWLCQEQHFLRAQLHALEQNQTAPSRKEALRSFDMEPMDMGPRWVTQSEFVKKEADALEKQVDSLKEERKKLMGLVQKAKAKREGNEGNIDGVAKSTSGKGGEASHAA